MRPLLATLWLLLVLAIVVAVAGGVAHTVSELEPGWSPSTQYAVTLGAFVVLLAGLQRVVRTVRQRRVLRDRRESRNRRDRRARS